MTRAILAKLGYTIIAPEEFEALVELLGLRGRDLFMVLLVGVDGPDVDVGAQGRVRGASDQRGAD